MIESPNLYTVRRIGRGTHRGQEWALINAGTVVDWYYRQRSAESAAELLNVGAATLAPHATTGCRAIPKQWVAA